MPLGSVLAAAEGVPPGVVAAFVAGAGVVVGYQFWRRAQLADAYRRLLVREGLEATTTPCQLDADALSRLRSCPEGDRSYGLDHGVTGPVTLVVGGVEHEVECAAFVWWWEEEHHSTDSEGRTTTTYTTETRVVGALRLPVAVPMVSAAPEGFFARLGLGGRDDMQLESEEFNRRFDVRVAEADRGVAVRLFDAAFQRLLLERFDGRQIEFVGDLLVVAGDPHGRDPDLYGDVGELPGARRDAVLLASSVPDSFWRGVAAASSEAEEQR